MKPLQLEINRALVKDATDLGDGLLLMTPEVSENWIELKEDVPGGWLQRCQPCLDAEVKEGA